MNVISTEVKVKPERSGEIPCGSLSIMLLLYSFRPYLSAKPTVGRFALGPPTGNPCGQVFKTYRFATIVFAPALVSTALELTKLSTFSLCIIMLLCKFGHRRLAFGGSPTGGRGTPKPFKAFPLGGRWIAEAKAKARRMRGRAMTSVT